MIGAGRPPEYEERMQSITLSVPGYMREWLDAQAASHPAARGSRSYVVRELIENAMRGEEARNEDDR